MNHYILSLTLALTACGRPGDEPEPEVGPKGEAGDIGAPGQDAEPCTVYDSVTGAVIVCPDGTTQAIKDGQNGATGPQGVAGPEGQSCTIQQFPGNAVITCGDTQAVIYDGAEGTPGVPGQDAPPTPYTITEMLDPCGDGPGYDEVLLRLANGNLVAHFFSGNFQFLTTLSPGAYVTTDQQACQFSVDAGGQVSW